MGGDSGNRISVEELSFTYPGAAREALSGINLFFEQGEFCAILGRNGSGKSTLARCLNAILAPSGGKVTSCGLDTRDQGGSLEIKKRIAMVFEDPDTQIVGTTVEEEVAFGPENLRLSTDVIRERVDSSLELTGIREFIGRQPSRLSEGQKQVVAIAGALAMEPAFLVSDESTSMLDTNARQRILELFLSLKEKGMGIIHVTHFLEEAAMSDRVVVLDNGRVRAEGAPGDVLYDPVKVSEMGLDPLPVTIVAREMSAMGYPPPGPVLTVEELLACIRA
jgi:energy-coupling factor transport system ATP-binding protein